MPDMDRISPLPPFWSKNTLLSFCCSSFWGFSGPQRRIQSIFQSFFFCREEERVGSREAPLVSQGSEETRSPLRHFPDQRRLLEAPTCWEETF